MKKIILSIALIASSYIVNAQLEVGVTAGYGTTWLLNKSVSDSPEIDYKPSFAGAFGLQSSFFINNQIGFGLELNFATIIQRYEAQDNGNFTAKERIKFVEIPILMKLKSEGGFYFEVGPKLSFTGKATQDLDVGVPALNYDDRDIKSGVNGLMISGVIGFGGRFNLTEEIDLAVGLRLAANFNDLNKEFTAAELNALDAQNKEIGISCGYGNVDKHGDLNYVKTWVLSGLLQVGVTYRIGEEKDKKRN